jgi:hypothetical protein
MTQSHKVLHSYLSVQLVQPHTLPFVRGVLRNFERPQGKREIRSLPNVVWKLVSPAVSFVDSLREFPTRISLPCSFDSAMY